MANIIKPILQRKRLTFIEGKVLLEVTRWLGGRAGTRTQMSDSGSMILSALSSGKVMQVTIRGEILSPFYRNTKIKWLAQGHTSCELQWNQKLDTRSPESVFPALSQWILGLARMHGNLSLKEKLSLRSWACGSGSASSLDTRTTEGYLSLVSCHAGSHLCYMVVAKAWASASDHLGFES